MKVRQWKRLQRHPIVTPGPLLLQAGVNYVSGQYPTPFRNAVVDALRTGEPLQWPKEATPIYPFKSINSGGQEG